MPEPPAPPVRGLVQSDAVDPSLKTGLTIKVLHAAKHLEKDFLGSIGGIGGIGNQAVNQAVDGLVKLTNQPSVGFLRSGLQFSHERRFLLPDSNGSREITHAGRSRHHSHGSNSIIGSFLATGLTRSAQRRITAGSIGPLYP